MPHLCTFFFSRRSCSAFAPFVGIQKRVKISSKKFSLLFILSPTIIPGILFFLSMKRDISSGTWNFAARQTLLHRRSSFSPTYHWNSSVVWPTLEVERGQLNNFTFLLDNLVEVGASRKFCCFKYGRYAFRGHSSAVFPAKKITFSRTSESTPAEARAF